MNIGNTLTDLRKRKGLSRQNLADELGISVHTYIKCENESVKPPYETLSKLADFYGVTTDYLLGRETGEPSPLDELSAQFNLSALEKKIVDNYLALPKDMRGDLMEFLQKSVKEVSLNNEPCKCQ